MEKRLKKPIKKKKSSQKDYQAVTLQIMEDNGLQTGYRGYSDPIYRSQMYARALQGISHSSHPVLKVSVGIFFAAFPYFLIYSSIMNDTQFTSSDMLLIGLVSLFVCIPLVAVGLRLIISGIYGD